MPAGAARSAGTWPVGHDGSVSTSWTTPDARPRPATPPVFGAPDVAVADGAAPPLRNDLVAGLLAAVVSVLLAAPVGLLWAAFAPRLEVSVDDAGAPSLVRPVSDEFITADAYFLLAVGLAGVVGGVVAWRLGRVHGPAVVAGLCVGGLVAGWVAMSVGELVDQGAVQRAIDAGRMALVEASLRVRAKQALVAWPVGSLLSYVGASFVRGR